GNPGGVPPALADAVERVAGKAINLFHHCSISPRDRFKSNRALAANGATMLFGAWLLHSVRLAAALGIAIVAMQAPAVTREYQAALPQLVRSSAEDIAQRKASAQRFFVLERDSEEALHRRAARRRAVKCRNADGRARAREEPARVLR